MIIAAVFMFLLGLALSLLLTIASRVFYVREDPRLERVKAILPGLNCGG
jgi:electron transport complex protein RnfB